jgi:hypothetical protein
MSALLISSVIGTLIGGKVPSAMVDFVIEAVPVAVESVQKLREVPGNGGSKASTIAELLAELADEHLDQKGSSWSSMSEAARDEMLYGMVEWVYTYDIFITMNGLIKLPEDEANVRRMVSAPFLWLDLFKSHAGDDDASKRSRRRKMRRKLLQIFRKKTK